MHCTESSFWQKNESKYISAKNEHCNEASFDPIFVCTLVNYEQPSLNLLGHGLGLAKGVLRLRNWGQGFTIKLTQVHTKLPQFNRNYPSIVHFRLKLTLAGK